MGKRGRHMDPTPEDAAQLPQLCLEPRDPDADSSAPKRLRPGPPTGPPTLVPAVNPKKPAPEASTPEPSPPASPPVSPPAFPALLCLPGFLSALHLHPQ